MIAEHPNIGFHPFVVVLHLSLCLRVVGHGEVLINVQGFEEALGIVGCEEGTLVCIVYSGCTMVLPYMLEVELYQVCCCGSGVSGNEMCHFC